jgi:hypothetical protein
MSKIETIIVGLLIGIACPLVSFVIFWWSSALIHRYVPSIPLNIVITSAITGLGLGLLLDMLLLKRWVQRFYISNIWLMIVLYIGRGIIAVAFFMGLPFGTIALGTFAGIYMGRRAKFIHADGITTVLSLQKTALITASFTAMASFPIGILALNEKDVLEMLENFSGIKQANLEGIAGLILITILCGLLFLIQYWFTRKAGLIAYNKDNRNAQHLL